VSQHFTQHVIDHEPVTLVHTITAWFFKIYFNIVFSIYFYTVSLHVTTKVL